MIFDYSSAAFVQNYVYEGSDLGVRYQKHGTTFKLWSPYAERVDVMIYKVPSDSTPWTVIPMTQSENGVFVGKTAADIENMFYVYSVAFGSQVECTPDPYSTAVSVGGAMSAVVDFSKTNPTGWDKDKFVTLASNTDAVIYETHVRDFTIDENSGCKSRGKFVSIAENGTKSKEGCKTGLDHLQELGITHLHLLPINDYATVDETRYSKFNYNWGYDPLHYNAVEGSYSTDPFRPAVRIRELKHMIKTLHDKKIGVVMDVVFNHTYLTAGSVFNKCVPDYYYRKNSFGEYSNGSGCGNEIASEREMVSKYIIDSLAFWMREYHIDGFRFDLMGVIDCETINKACRRLIKINPNALLYGEGWSAAECALPYEKLANKSNLKNLPPRIAMFNDTFRDAVKGSTFSSAAKGYVSGADELTETVKAGITACCPNDNVSYAYVKGVSEPFAVSPQQTVNYNSCHDNYTLYDKLQLSCTDRTSDEILRMNKLSAVILFTSQGIPFFQSGEEFLRSKKGEFGMLMHNSYNLPDDVNMIRWENKYRHRDIFEYYKGLISLRKKHPAFRLQSAEQIDEHLEFIYTEPSNRIAYLLKNYPCGDPNEAIAVVLNPTTSSFTLTVPDGNWGICVNAERASDSPFETVAGNHLEIPPISAVVAVKL